jgi:hypothetical protein
VRLHRNPLDSEQLLGNNLSEHNIHGTKWHMPGVSYTGADHRAVIFTVVDTKCQTVNSPDCPANVTSSDIDFG